MQLISRTSALRITNDALQIWGAAGYSRNNPMERYVRDARMFTIAGGTAQMLRNLVAGNVLGRRFPQSRELLAYERGAFDD